MSVEILVEQLKHLIEALNDAIQNDDTKALKRIDAEIEAKFSNILSFEPTSKQERIYQCSFLIDHLAPPQNRQGLNARVYDKLINLISND